MKLDPNNSAFPQSETKPINPLNAEHRSEYDYLTKRELIAAMAMQGWLASFGTTDCKDVIRGTVAEFCVSMADALLAALSAKEQA